jgi:hypothetical protein
MSADRRAFLEQISTSPLDPKEFIGIFVDKLTADISALKHEIEILQVDIDAHFEKLNKNGHQLEELERMKFLMFELGRTAILCEDATRLLEVSDSLLKDDEFHFHAALRDCYHYVILKLDNKDQINQALLRLATIHMEGMLVVSGSKLATKYERMSLPDTETVDIADKIAILVDDQRLYDDWFYRVRKEYISEKKRFCDFLQQNYLKK